MTDKFIELHRTFRDLPKEANESDDTDFSQWLPNDKRLRWPDLIQERRLVILSEAGSGKTTEIRNIAHSLRNQGKSAFFLRLEHVADDFEDSFEEGTYEEFVAWLTSNNEGWLFLDSVDEARLRNPSDFELAIRKLSRKISPAKDRAHIVITGRTTAWRPKTDLNYCNDCFPYAPAATSKHDPKANIVESEEAIKPDGSVLTETIPKKENDSFFRIVALHDLASDQIEVFVKARGIADSKAFLDAVERADAWSFTARPQDLEELTGFWLDHNQIGSRLEIMQNSIERRLTERDPDRADARPLSTERARQGTRLLAAAATLTRESAIKVPDGSANSKGIDVRSVLPDWNSKDQSTLLPLPIFDEAIYGTVRFHHRSVREYLAAEWFRGLLKRETSRRNIEALFFRNQYGLDIVAPTLRPILPWLILWDEKIGGRVRKLAPEILFEGGDPSRLPVAVRRSVLHDVCKQMASNTTGRTMRDEAAVQRFAGPDLTDDVLALLREYADNDDLKAFLLRMIWIGQLEGARQEVMEVALNPQAERYVRIVAFRAIKAIGSKEDQEHVCQNFLAEAPKLNREWFAELVEGRKPTEQALTWLLAGLEKLQPVENYYGDNLLHNLTAFVEEADIELLPKIIESFNKLLDLPPVIEQWFCEISEQFQWLIAPACKAVERLISIRHPASLKPHALEILYKLPSVREYEINRSSDFKAEFSKLITAWKKLNSALFWFEVRKSRNARDKRNGERLTEFYQVPFRPFWRFEESDFESITEEISNRTFLDDRLVALSLSFDLYKKAGRPAVWRRQLKKLVADSEELSVRLSSYLNPPAQDLIYRRIKQQKSKWNRQHKTYQKQQEKNLADWKEYFNEKLNEASAALRESPGILTNALLYLFDQTRKTKNSTNRRTDYNWRVLIPEYGEKVARYYRDGTVCFWRHYKPKLRSEGAPFNETTYGVIIGLIGLEIEAHETEDWSKHLNPDEVELVCRYASFELNGFPVWFPRFFETYPQLVSDFLMQEIRYELSIETPEAETHYIISDLSWAGQWAWDQIAPELYDLLNGMEPKNLANLDKLLKIIQDSGLTDNQIEALASQKCRILTEWDHVARWFAVWMSVTPDEAMSAFITRIGSISDPEQQTLFAMIFVTQLLGGRRTDGSAVLQTFKTPQHLKSLYLLMHKYIRREDDIDRAGKGVYSPGLRDDAQDARSNLFKLLNQIPGKESFLALMEISEAHPDEKSRQWAMLQAKTKAEQDGDIETWLPVQVKEFNEQLERIPSNHKELYELAVLRLEDLKHDLEHGDSSIASTLQKITLETEMRKFIGRELREKAFGRYSIQQEEELADAKRIDLRFQGMSFDGPVPVELKLADNWSGPKLFERLENQLCGDYLRDDRSNRGIFVLVCRGEQHHWEIHDSGRLDFIGLVEALQKHWQHISPEFPEVDDITVIGIDLTKRSC
ncbi:NACHT domain-containing protein [Nitrosomonas oligotropha]|uniref:Uncharacterized protein n=1 Tax=Nitrosomonas oligotropha TaxID=42354 RepID=A0A1H8UJ74_9PROT|nr:hypothetical protein [Nitrosomonas oligotropha]SDX47249.1 hypothetical protein SAMN05216300_14011 [Nitrosomonas oligotropha]SEP03067.1 hypothetical protein SAMN05216333_13612 [Nitrosomonas oligotropha]